MPLEKGKYVGKDNVFKWLRELVRRSIEIILMGNRREGVPLLTPGSSPSPYGFEGEAR